MNIQDLQKQFFNETGMEIINSQGEPELDYVQWLEKKIVESQPTEGTKLYSEDQVIDIGCKIANEIKKNGFGGHSTARTLVSTFIKDLNISPFLIHKDKEGYSKEEQFEIFKKHRALQFKFEEDIHFTEGWDNDWKRYIQLLNDNGFCIAPISSPPPLQKDKEEMTDEEIEDLICENPIIKQIWTQGIHQRTVTQCREALISTYRDRTT